MSQGRPMHLATARRSAGELVELLRPSCERIEIAGSIRRGKPMVADIEIVAMPRVMTEPGADLWGTPTQVDRLALTLGLLVLAGRVALRDVASHRQDGSVDVGHRDGDAYKALTFEGLPVDLFIVTDPDTWGLHYALRTGPGDWNTRLVTDCKKYLRAVRGGHVYRAGLRVPVPEEIDFFTALGQPWVEPEDRHASRVAIRPKVEASL